MRNSNKRKTLALALLWCAMLALGAVMANLIWTPQGPETLPRLRSIEGSNCANHEREGYESSQKRTSGRDAPGTIQPAEHAVAVSSGAEREDHAVDQRVEIRIECRTAAGAPVAFLPFRCVIQSPPETYGTDEWFASTTTPSTNRDGTIGLRASQQHVLVAHCESEKWYCEPLRCDFRVSQTFLLVVRPVADLAIRVQYADGDPYQHTGLLEDIEDDGYVCYFDCNEDGVANLKGVPIDRTLAFRTTGGKLKAGYAGWDASDLTMLKAHELSSGRELLVVIPRAVDPLGLLRVEFLNKPPEVGTYILESELARSAGGTYRARGATSWTSGSLQPMKYRISFLGEVAWRSEWVEVEAGRETLVEATFLTSGGVRARLVNPQFEPIQLSVLRLPDGNYFSRPKRTSVARGGVDTRPAEPGVTELSGLPPGRVTLLAEAEGKEPVELEVDVVSGTTTDLGDVVLEDAVGEVSVEIFGQKENVEYAIAIFQPSGGLVMPLQPIEGGNGVVRGLPLRMYRVAVTGTRGGSVVGEFITLTHDEPTRSLRLDVSTVVPD